MGDILLLFNIESTSLRELQEYSHGLLGDLGLTVDVRMCSPQVPKLQSLGTEAPSSCAILDVNVLRFESFLLFFVVFA